MADFNWDQFQSAPQAQAPAATPPSTTATSQQPAPVANAESFNWDQFKAAPVDKATGEMQPAYADGSSAATPLNTSPVSIEDRFKLSMGDAKGNEDYLKKQYGPDNVLRDTHDKLVVKTDGNWHRVDPKGLGDGDAWERTQELIKDAAGAVPSMWKGATSAMLLAKKPSLAIAAAGAGFGALADAYGEDVSKFVGDHPKSVGLPLAAAATILGGAGLMSGKTGAALKANAPLAALAAVNETARTSLGRFYGTFSDDTETQMKAVGFETLLTLGMSPIGAGIKPTAEVTADLLKGTAKTLGNAPQASKELITNIVGGMTSKSPGDIMNYLDNAGPVSNWIKQTGGDAVDLTKKLIGKVSTIAEQAQPALSKIWETTQNKLLATVDDLNFKSNIDDVVRTPQVDGAKNGIGKFMKLVTPEEVPVGPMSRARPTKPTWMEVPPEEIEAHAAGGGQGLPKGVKFQLKSFEELTNDQKATGDVIKEVSTEEGYAFIKKFYDGLDRFDGMTTLEGRKGARQLLDFKQVMGNNVYQLSEGAKEASMPKVAQAIKSYEESINSRVAAKFAVPEKVVNGVTIPGSNPFLELNEMYSNTRDQLSSIRRVVDQAKNSGNDQPYETLLKQLTSKGEMNITKKDSFAAAINVAKEAGFSEIAQTAQQLKDLSSARALSSWISSPAQKTLLMSAPGVTAVNPLAGLGMAATGAAMSPRVNRFGLDAGLAIQKGVQNMASGVGITQAIDKVSPALLQGGIHALDFLKQLPREQMTTLLKNPEMLQFMSTAVTRVPEIEQGLSKALVGHALDRATPVDAQPQQVSQEPIKASQ